MILRRRTGDPAGEGGFGRAGLLVLRPMDHFAPSAYHVYTTAGRFGEVCNQDGLLADGVVAEFYVHKSRGAPIGASLSSSDRVASFMVRAETAEELLRKTVEAMKRLDVVDVDGRSIIRRDICLKAL